jgi:serpin B
MKRWVASLCATLMGLMLTVSASTLAHESSIHLQLKTSLLNESPVITAQQTSKQTAEVEAVVKGNNAFALDLYRQLRNPSGNLFVSPYSLSTALAMTYAGARGQTATEMSKVLHFTLGQEDLHPAFAALRTQLEVQKQQGEGVQLKIANRLWGQQGYNFLQPFNQLTQDYYGAALEEVDFSGDTEKARRTINQWVAQQTQEKIKDLIPPAILNSLTRIVLTNAIYFKGSWLKPFNPTATKNKPFTVAPGQQVDVPMMSQSASVGYAEFGELQVLELLYVGEKISMVILLPKKIDGLTQLEQQLTPENIQNWLSSINYSQCPTSIQLPKFKVDAKFELKSVLSKMGMVSAFDEGTADFSGMNGSKDLFLREAIHQTLVNVDELGTEAAGATAVIGELRCGGGNFSADRPFMFLIRDKQSGSILFLGRVMNPMASAKP